MLSQVRRTMKIAFPASSFSSASLRTAEESLRSYRYIIKKLHRAKVFLNLFNLHLQVFSRQAVQMDALISAFVDEIKQKAALYSEEGDNIYSENSAETDECLVPLTTVSRRGIPESCLSNKLTRLTLATFYDEGHCIGHMGSWSFSS